MFVFLAIIFKLFLEINFVQSEKCSTPNITVGNRLPLEECPKIQSIIEMQTIKPDIDTFRYLINSLSGFNLSHVMVCCPLENQATDFEFNNKVRHFKIPNHVKSIDNKGAITRNCGYQRNTRNDNDNVIAIHSDPWLVTIIYEKQRPQETICKGVLIDKKYVLTAAECVKGNLIENNGIPISISFGTHNVPGNNCGSSNDSNCNHFPLNISINNIIIHHQKSADLALIHLSRAIEFDDSVWPICLPSDNFYANAENAGYMYTVGWRTSSANSKGGADVNKPDSKVSIVKCFSNESDSENNVENSYICTDSEEACRGNLEKSFLVSLITNNHQQYNWYISGISTNGGENCSNNTTVKYTKISTHLDWILRNML